MMSLLLLYQFKVFPINRKKTNKFKISKGLEKLRTYIKKLPTKNHHNDEVPDSKAKG
jgi:hypothetical protein